MILGICPICKKTCSIFNNPNVGTEEDDLALEFILAKHFYEGKHCEGLDHAPESIIIQSSTP